MIYLTIHSEETLCLKSFTTLMLKEYKESRLPKPKVMSVVLEKSHFLKKEEVLQDKVTREHLSGRKEVLLMVQYHRI